MEDSVPRDPVVTIPVSDRRSEHRGSERRAKPRPVFSEEAKRLARKRSVGVCECVNHNCWHAKRCKTRADAYVLRRITEPGEVTCSFFCRECAKTASRGGTRL